MKTILARIKTPIPKFGRPTVNRIAILLAMAVSFELSCVEQGPEKNSSAMMTVPMNSVLSFVSSYALDNNSEHMYMCFIDFGIETSKMLKIDLRTLTVEKSIVLPPGFQTWGGNNLVVTKNNKIAVMVKDARTYVDLTMLYNTDLTLEHVDTLAHLSAPFFINRLFINNNGDLAGIYNNVDTAGQTVIQYIEYDNNLNRSREITQVITDSTFPRISGGYARLCNDGDILYAMAAYQPPANQEYLRLEKRTPDFELVWSTTFSTDLGAFFYNIIEVNNKFYVYGHGGSEKNPAVKSFIVLVYDQLGNLLERKDLENDLLSDKRSEPIVATPDGGFLTTGLTSNGTDILSRKAILFKLDANLNVVNSQVLGGGNDVSSSGLQQIGPNRFLLMYSENSFESNPDRYRLVLRYVDEDGNLEE